MNMTYRLSEILFEQNFLSAAAKCHALVIQFFAIRFLQITMFFLFLKNAEFSVDTVCLLLCFGRDKGKKMRFSVEGDCSDGTTIIFIKADRFAITGRLIIRFSHRLSLGTC